jgi:hypothetical protein
LYIKQKRYDKAEELLVKSVGIGRHKLVGKHPETLSNFIALYEAWNKPEKAKEWQAKLPQIEAVNE